MSVDAAAQQGNFTFSGLIIGRKDPRTRTKGVMAARRRQKRAEAEARNANTPTERTAKYRREQLSVSEV